MVKTSLSDALEKSNKKKSSNIAVADPLPSTKSREGKRYISGCFDPAVLKQFKSIGVNEDKKGQELLAEALNLLFESRNLPQIAE